MPRWFWNSNRPVGDTRERSETGARRFLSASSKGPLSNPHACAWRRGREGASSFAAKGRASYMVAGVLLPRFHHLILSEPGPIEAPLFKHEKAAVLSRGCGCSGHRLSEQGCGERGRGPWVCG